MTGISPFLRWALAIIAGGGLAGTFLYGVSPGSLPLLPGLGNPVVSTAEAGGSVALSIAAIAMPLVALAVPATAFVILLKLRRKLIKERAVGHPWIFQSTRSKDSSACQL